jgi:putative hydrolase of the HAD superfamily
MSKIRAAVFDCYSTLIDIKTNEQKDDIFNYLVLYLQYYGAKTAAGQLRADINLKRERHLKSKDEPYPEIDLEIIFREILKEKGLNSPFLAESCCKLLRLLSRERFQLFPDSLPVLEDMRKSKYPLAVVSDAQKVFCPEEGEILGIRQFFRVFILSTDFGFRKPDSRLFTIACTLLGMPPADVVYIGNDPEADVKGAQGIGMKAILLDRQKGFRNPEPKPDFYATDLWQAWKWIKDNSHGSN